MTTARRDVLARIRSALTDRPDPAPVIRTYRGVSERDTGLPHLGDLLAERLVDYRAAVERVTEGADVDAVVLAALQARGASRVAVPARFAAANVPGAVRDNGGLTAEDLDGLDGVVTACTIAIAETGTIVLDHAAPDQGRRMLSLLPDYHLVIVRADQIVAGVPDALVRLAPTHPQTWISGPSATSDIELERIEGVHGPRTLHVVIVG